MNNEPILRIYTQPGCRFCDVMKQKLDEWGYKYTELNIKENTAALMFLKGQGHKTVPQLYINDTHVNDVDTFDLSKEYLDQKLYQAWSNTGVYM